MNFNLVEMYNGLLRFNKHILNELKTKVETYSNKINELEQRVHQLENASQS